MASWESPGNHRNGKHRQRQETAYHYLIDFSRYRNRAKLEKTQSQSLRRQRLRVRLSPGPPFFARCAKNAAPKPEGRRQAGYHNEQKQSYLLNARQITPFSRPLTLLSAFTMNFIGATLCRHFFK